MPVVKVNGVNINYKVEGQGEPLVMVMGFAGDQRGWRYQIPAFKKHYQVITFDNRGVGKSDKPQGPYTIGMMAKDTVCLMDYLGIKQAHIMGVSMGGYMAQEIASNYPEKVTKLILGCTQANPVNGTTAETLEAWSWPIRKLIARVFDLSVDRRLNRLIFMPIIKFRCRRMDESAARGLLGQKEACAGFNGLEKLKHIQAPTLVIVGTNDRVIMPTSSELMAKEIPLARLVTIKNGSHLVFQEASKTFNNEVLNFLKSTEVIN
jgi:pimeloyl-ACP methyl ester carboxylesterase